jgi:putative ABC transport system permease protein
MRFLIEGRPELPPHLQPSLQVHFIAPDYFQAMGIPLLQGRDFTEEGNRKHQRSTSSGNEWGAGLNSIIIDEEFAKRHWRNQNPLGQRVRIPWGERVKQPIVSRVGRVGRVKENRSYANVPLEDGNAYSRNASRRYRPGARASSIVCRSDSEISPVRDSQHSVSISG